MRRKGVTHARGRTEGIFFSAAVAMLFTQVEGVLAMVCIRCRCFPHSWEDFMFLSEGFGGEQADNRELQLFDREDVLRESQRADMSAWSTAPIQERPGGWPRLWRSLAAISSPMASP